MAVESRKWNGRVMYRVSVSDRRSIFASQLVSAHNGMLIPIGPVDPVFENSDGKWMTDGRLGRQNHSSVGSIKVATAYEVHFGVDPKKTFVDAVECDAVWPFDVRIDQHLSMRAVHSRPLDSRQNTPIRPIEPTVNRVNSNRSRLLQPIGEQRFAESAFEVGHLDRVLGRVGPVKVSIDPINGQSVDIDHVAEDDDRFGFAFVNGRLVDPPVDDVAPEQHSALEMKVQRCRAASFVDNGCQITTVERKTPDIRPMGEQQGRVAFVSFATRPIVWITSVSSQTFTFEGAFFVDTRLRARTRFQTLVHIFFGPRFWCVCVKVNENA